MTNKTPRRIYVVTDTDTDEKRLVKAASAPQAIRHAADHYRAEVASQDALVRLLGEDIEVENAGEQPVGDREAVQS